MSKNRWSIWIDVEGFSFLYQHNKTRAIQAIGELMEALFNIGSEIFNEFPNRLFIHQFGDGFVIVSNFPEDIPDRPIAICIAVMRHLIMKGIATKAVISGGDFADISSCYPTNVLEASIDRRYVKIGEGIMTIMPVMGSALISAHKLSKTKSGAILLFDTIIFSSIPNSITISAGSPATIDWVHSDFHLVSEICNKANLAIDTNYTEQKLLSYIEENKNNLSKNWIESTLKSIGING